MKYTISIISALVVSLTISAFALTPRQAFISAPSEIISTIDSITRLDMIDYFEAGATGASHNALGGDCRITALDDSHIALETSGVSSLDLFLLPAGRNTAIAVISSLRLPAHDATLNMFSSSWQPNNPGKLPPTFNNLDLWLLPEGRNERTMIENIVPFIPVSMVISDNNLIVSNTLNELLTPDDFNKVKNFIIPSLTYVWNGKRWTALK